MKNILGEAGPEIQQKNTCSTQQIDRDFLANLIAAQMCQQDDHASLFDHAHLAIETLEGLGLLKPGLTLTSAQRDQLIDRATILKAQPSA